MTDEARLKFKNPKLLSRPAGYSHVVEVQAAKLIFISGQVAMDADGNLVGKDSYGAQAEHVYHNLKIALESAGTDFSHVVRIGYFIRDVAHLPEVRQVRDRYIDVDNPPASTAVEISSLFRDEFLLEIEAVAAV